ncbi:TPA: GyrI-like domain-containing protein [Salmonella enterica subsp. enterica serovar Java]|uniref:AraC family transcriptional regulator n=1 Tax=Enterobacteriaceae TaxID=543 RepID=UPI001A18BE56|nr:MULTISPECIES: GyrI-like domain-containing protein [Enterobacteriaceae]EHJ8626390.1 GyrI-like domain-containing protein [Salmonella enterica subsp. enterica serovar 4,[5],12:i:-]EHL9471345.1 GyrI-like domain-containing protein [Salmonella enterica subsp. enterica serovar Newport]MBJ5598138.1 GyrI-like domain-containing protein [Salmonella enterica subsp. enterica serovar Thompson]HCZ4708862.1 GyrI-like domain-containing protein [Salmonella enterica subsp. enterica serovar Saintpaul str. CFSAN
MARVGNGGMVDYQARLRPVIRALEQNPDLSIEMLASSACLSFYHFHRVFTAVTGETPGKMCRRLRIQRAAWQLRYTDASITDIAMEAGLASSQALAKIFRRYYDCTPGEFRRDKSKNGHQISKDGHAITRANPYTESHLSARSNTMKTIDMEARTLAYIRVTGPYGEGYGPVYDQLYQWARARGLEGGEWISIYLDNPEVTPPAQCRTDIGVTVPADTEGTGAVEIQLIPAGRYAQSRYLITDLSQYGSRWQEHIGDIVAAGLEFGDGPCFELYHSMTDDPMQVDVSLCSCLKG